jgi:hypothetical protein
MAIPSPYDAMPLSFVGPSKSTLRFEDLNLWSHALKQNTGFKEPLREFWDPGYRAVSATPAAFSLVTNKARAEQDENDKLSQLAQMDNLTVPPKATPGVISLEDPLSSFAGTSLFDITTQHLPGLATPSSPHALSSIAKVMDQLDEEEASYKTPALAGTNRPSWDGYGWTEQTNFGSSSSDLKKRRASHSRAGSSIDLSCEGCDKVFASKAERE